MIIDPTSTYVSLGQDGKSIQLPGGDAFWSQPKAEIEAVGKDWLVSEYTFTADWPNWEMHPEGDEMVYLLEGHVRLLLDLPAARRELEMQGRGAVVIPMGVWHTAKVMAPSRTLHITLGRRTQHRPAQ